MQKIIIFTCAGGGGHLAASGALESYLNGSYQIKIVNILAEVLQNYDFFSVVTWRHFSYEQFYNLLVRHRYTWFINAIYPIGRFYFWLMQGRIEKTIERYIRAENPAMVISVIVLVNRAIADACNAANIPFLLSTTDLEPQTFLVKMQNVNYPLFRINLPFYDDQIIQKVSERGIATDKMIFLGFPLRPAFFKHYDSAQLRKQYQLDPDIPVVLITMGAQGSTGLIKAVNALKELPIPAQLVITLGKSAHLREKLEAIALPPWIFRIIVDGTTPMAELMAMADVAIIKAGSATFCEAIQSGCPMLIDQTSRTPIWELFNNKFVKKYRIGDCFKNYDQLPCMVERLLVDETYRNNMIKSLAQFKRSDPAPAFNNLVVELIQQRSGQKVMKSINKAIF